MLVQYIFLCTSIAVLIALASFLAVHLTSTLVVCVCLLCCVGKQCAFGSKNEQEHMVGTCAAASHGRQSPSGRLERRRGSLCSRIASVRNGTASRRCDDRKVFLGSCLSPYDPWWISSMMPLSNVLLSRLHT
jgi:hypothetical protein